MTSIHSVFIVTKPLQLIICEIISEQLNLKQKTLILVNAFKGAKVVAQNISEQGFWSKVHFVETKREEVREVFKIRPDELFVIGDVGFRAFLFLLTYKLLVNKPLWVYEEGHANYGNEWYSDGFKKWLFKQIGIGVQNGGCRFTNGLYVFSPNKIPARSLNVRTDFTIRKIYVSLQDYCVNHLKRYCIYFNISEQLFPEDKIGDIWHLCLSDWSLNTAVDFAKRTLDGLKVLKPHPHIKNNDALNIPGFDVVLDGAIPVELLLIKMAATSNKIIVWHYGSSVSRYIKLPNVEFRMLT